MPSGRDNDHNGSAHHHNGSADNNDDSGWHHHHDGRSTLIHQHDSGTIDHIHEYHTHNGPELPFTGAGETALMIGGGIVLLASGGMLLRKVQGT